METLIFSLGGSIIAPDKPDYFFLREFKNFLIRFRNRCIIVCGGGGTNRNYNEAAKRVSNVSSRDLDWIGVRATWLNAELVRSVFGRAAYHRIIVNPKDKVKTNKRIIVAGGWKPGWSTDYVAVLLAGKFKAGRIFNLTNVTHVYSKDPSRHSDAQRIEKISWAEYRELVGDKWTPRMSSPFDPVASREADRLGIEVFILKGDNLSNVLNCISGIDYEGTHIFRRPE